MQSGSVKVKGQKVRGQAVLFQAGLALPKSLQAEVTKKEHSKKQQARDWRGPKQHGDTNIRECFQTDTTALKKKKDSCTVQQPLATCCYLNLNKWKLN